MRPLIFKSTGRATLFAVLVFITSSAIAAPGPGGRATPVLVELAQLVTMAPKTWVAGTVISQHQARLAAEVEGKIKYIAEVGTQVVENDVLVKIDPTFINLRIEEYKAAVERDRANLEFLKADLKRLKRLALNSNASQTLLDRTRADREVAKNELQISRTRLKQAKEEKERHFIRAPFPGVVTDRLMRRGERAGIGDEVISMVDRHELEVQARVPLDTLDYVHPDDVLTIKVNNTEKLARVRTLVAAGDERSRLLELRLALAENGWTIGQPVRIALPVAVAKEALVVPRDALVLRRDGATVFRIGAESKAERVTVKLGVASGSLIEVIPEKTGAINIGDRIVTRGSERLRPGQIVTILNADKLDKNQNTAVVKNNNKSNESVIKENTE